MKTNKRILGDYGENLAVNFLVKNKYKIITTNFDARVGEIDIIAIETKAARIKRDKDIPKVFLNEDVIVFVEVKTRSSNFFGEPSEAVDTIKQEKCIKASRVFLTQNKKLSGMQVRYDIIEVLDGVVNHIINAF